MNLFFNDQEQRPRAGWRLIVQFILFVFLVGFAALAFQALWQSSLSIAMAIPQFLGTAASIWLAARFLDKRPLTEYGLTFNTRWIKDFVAGVLIAGIVMGVIFAVEWQLGWLSITGFGWETTTEVPFGTALLSSFTAMLLVGFYEEWLSRGYQLLNLSEGLSYPQLGHRWPVIIATLATSALFGLMHAFNPNSSYIAVINIILAGIVLAVPYVLTGKLGLSVGLHFSWNFMQGAVFGFPVSGTRLDTSIIQIAQQGPDLWTGGAFGPEAGGIGIAGMAIMLGGSYVYIMWSGYDCSIAGVFQKGYQRSAKSDEQAL